MLGRKERDQLEFFVAGSLRELLPDDHVLVRVDRVLDLSWLHSEVTGLYCSDNGRPGIDPEVAGRLMLAGFVLGFVQDRRLMREAQVNLAIRWFAGYGLHEALPDHSSLTRIRQRWGEALFRKVFMRVVQDCAQAGLITADTVHMDASLIRADVSMDALVDQHLDAVQDANDDQRQARTTGKYKKLCGSDPDASCHCCAIGSSNNGDGDLLRGASSPELQAAHGRRRFGIGRHRSEADAGRRRRGRYRDRDGRRT